MASSYGISEQVLIQPLFVLQHVFQVGIMEAIRFGQGIRCHKARSEHLFSEQVLFHDSVDQRGSRLHRVGVTASGDRNGSPESVRRCGHHAIQRQLVLDHVGDFTERTDGMVKLHVCANPHEGR